MLEVGNLKDLGLRTDNLRVSLVPWGLLTIGLFCGLVLLLETVGQPLIDGWKQLYSSLWVLVLLGVIQELFFRGYLMLVLKRMFQGPIYVVLIDSVIFASMHFIFPHNELLVPEAFIAGIAFSAVYYYYPNVVLASTAHVLLNVSFILFL